MGLDVADGLRACCSVFVLGVFAKAHEFVLAHLKLFYLVSKLATHSYFFLTILDYLNILTDKIKSIC